MKRKIHLIVRVIDNFGDIGFAYELISGLVHGPRDYRYVIWTDAPDSVRWFFERNPDDRIETEIANIDDHESHPDEVTLLLFHAPLLQSIESRLILRIDYLSFDAVWVESHGFEHISSHKDQRIYEIIPSPLPGSWGILEPERSKLLSKHTLAETYHLDRDLPWITIFAYEDHLQKIDLDLTRKYEILIMGWADRVVWNTIKRLPFLSVREFHSILSHSDWAIVRWEVSMIAAVSLGIPFFWDMYHERGWYPGEQSDQFFRYFGLDRRYQELHSRLNGQSEWWVSLSEMDRYLSEVTWQRKRGFPRLTEEIEKYIDSFYKSL